MVVLLLRHPINPDGFFRSGIAVEKRSLPPIIFRSLDKKFRASAGTFARKISSAWLRWSFYLSRRR
jgi:hypothetical protein